MLKKLYRYKYFLVVLFLIILGVFYWYFFAGDKNGIKKTVEAKKTNILQEVSVTGRVESAENVDLAFERGGKISKVNIQVGSAIKRGDILLTLENKDTSASLAEALAGVKAAEAKLAELRRGARQEEIKIEEAKVEAAKNSLAEAKKNLGDKLLDSQTKADDAIRNKIDQLFNGPKTYNPTLVFSESNLQLKSDLESGRAQIEQILKNWKNEQAKSNLEKIKLFLDNIAFSANKLFPSGTLTQTTIDGWKSDVSSARTNVNTAISNLTLAEEKEKSAEDNLDISESELKFKISGSSPEEILSGEADLEKALAQKKGKEAELEKTILHSPIDGVVSKMDAKSGEIVPANEKLVSVISNANNKITKTVPKADIAKVKIGQAAKVTLDAYGSDVLFNAAVSQIDPAETIIEGVATYKITIHFSDKDQRIKSGMTANIDIETDSKKHVVAVPSRAVYSKNNKKYVKKYINEKTEEEVEVNVGLRGSDGNIEIISGINEGDKILISIEE